MRASVLSLTPTLQNPNKKRKASNQKVAAKMSSFFKFFGEKSSKDAKKKSLASANLNHAPESAKAFDPSGDFHERFR
ncbi:hypothetical protein EON65_04300 [archaeon]|nr:MAG: hypothetical protein EON65_04300 [archaeon]